MKKGYWEEKYLKIEKRKRDVVALYVFITCIILLLSCLIFYLDKHKQKDKIEVYVNYTKSKRKIMTAKDLQGNPVEINEVSLEELKKKYNVVIRVDE